VPALIQVSFSRRGLWAILSSLFGSVLAGGRTESRLVRAARERDREAFSDLMQEYTPALKRFAARRVPERDCEDILQDTWIAAWEAIPSFDDNSKLRTWLYSICYHKIQDHWRREHRLPPVTQSFDTESLAPYLPSEYAKVDLKESLRDFWESCTPDQRELLRLYYSDGLTLNEISGVLGRNLNTVKYQFYRTHEIASRALGSSVDALLSSEAR
jgi:RNA polymerase sigma-70 factor (ECF subfamily)